MQKWIFPLSLALVLLPGPGFASDNGDLSRPLDQVVRRIQAKIPPKASVIVLDLEEMDGRVSYLNRYLSDQISTRLSNQKNLSTIPRETFAAHWRKESASLAAGVEPDPLELAKRLGAKFIVCGTATDLADIVHLNVKLLDSERGFLIGGVTRDIKKTAETESLIDSLGSKEDIEEQQRIASRRVQEVEMDQAIMARMRLMEGKNPPKARTAFPAAGYENELSSLWKNLEKSVRQD